MTREQMYTAQLKELGIWEEAFAPLVKELAQAERQRQRAQNEWSAQAKAAAEAKGLDPKKSKPDFGSSLWPIIDGLDKKILSYREAMGLTPKSLRRLRGQPTAAGGDSPESISAKLDRMLEREDPGTAWSFEAMAAAVPTVGTEPTATPPEDWWKRDEAGQPVNGLLGSASPGVSPELTNDAKQSDAGDE